MSSNTPVAAPPAATSQKKGKSKKAPDPVNTSKQIEDTIAQLEKNKAGDRELEAEIETEVKRANREVKRLLDTLDTDKNKLNSLQTSYTKLLTDMKRTERDLVKSKKRSDHLQKERDKAQQELNKKTTKNETLEKLSREMQNRNKTLQVRIRSALGLWGIQAYMLCAGQDAEVGRHRVQVSGGASCTTRNYDRGGTRVH